MSDNVLCYFPRTNKIFEISKETLETVIDEINSILLAYEELGYFEIEEKKFHGAKILQINYKINL